MIVARVTVHDKIRGLKKTWFDDNFIQDSTYNVVTRALFSVWIIFRIWGQFYSEYAVSLSKLCITFHDVYFLPSRYRYL